MTHSGGKPHAVGDRGQRYEVSFFDPGAGKRKTLGWASTMEGVESFVEGIRLHPLWTDPQIRDREAS